MPNTRKEKQMSIAAKAIVELFNAYHAGCNGPDDIRKRTGLPQERCEHLYNVFLLAQLDAIPDSTPADETSKATKPVS